MAPDNVDRFMNNFFFDHLMASILDLKKHGSPVLSEVFVAFPFNPLGLFSNKMGPSVATLHAAKIPLNENSEFYSILNSHWYFFCMRRRH